MNGPFKLIQDAGGNIDANSVMQLPDGSGCFSASFPLPKDHWLTAPGCNVPPMPLRLGTDDPRRKVFADAIHAATKYAVRSSTMNGKEIDFDPDAMCQNMVVGLLGYWSPDGTSNLCGDPYDNPAEFLDLLGPKREVDAALNSGSQQNQATGPSGVEAPNRRKGERRISSEDLYFLGRRTGTDRRGA